MAVCVCNPCRANHRVVVDGVEQPGQKVSLSTRARHEEAEAKARAQGDRAAPADTVPRVIPTNAEDRLKQGA